MAPSRANGTSTKWSTEYDTLRRQKLFQNPPSDHTAYPTLAAAIEPHIASFNAIFSPNGLLTHALRDIGTKTFLDGNPNATISEDGSDVRRNSLQVRIKEVFLEKSQLSQANKTVSTLKGREILPVECRERH
ncbi:hypothetical protein LTR66_014844, partial [Elasticomyces elasticus]